MSSSTLLAELNRIDKDIADQEKKKAGYDKKASDLEKKIIDTQKSIKSTTSSSMASSKRRQIEGYGKDKAKAVQDSANCTDKISKLREKRNSKNQQYQKALADEQKASAKKQSQQMKSIQDKYETRIRDLETQLSASVTSAVNNMSEENKENFASDGAGIPVHCFFVWITPESPLCHSSSIFVKYRNNVKVSVPDPKLTSVLALFLW